MAQNMYEYIKKQNLKSMAKLLHDIIDSDFVERDFCSRVCPYRNTCEDFECKVLDNNLDYVEMWLGGEIYAKECCEVNQNDK